MGCCGFNNVWWARRDQSLPEWGIPHLGHFRTNPHPLGALVGHGVTLPSWCDLSSSGSGRWPRSCVDHVEVRGSGGERNGSRLHDVLVQPGSNGKFIQCWGGCEALC